MTGNDRNGAGAGADIVVGVDGSDESFCALRWALREGAATGRQVNAVFGWTHSWDMGSEPDGDEAWERMRRDIVQRLRDWVDAACEGFDFDPGNLRLTSVHASGTSALLQIGANAHQIVVGRRSMGPVLRWFMGSLSASLAESAQVPVTIVRIADEERSVQDDIAEALAPGASHPRRDDGAENDGRPRPVVVGVDGSPTSAHALAFAAEFAQVHRIPMHVLFCWQMRDLDEVPGYEHAIAPVGEGQRHAERIVADMLEQAGVPDDVEVHAHAFHIPAVKGLISASRYARHLVVGSRGLHGLDAHFLGSVSKQVVNCAECTVTVVH